MRYLNLSALIDFGISSKIPKAIEIRPGVFISNNPKHFRTDIHQEARNAIGGLEMDLLLSGAPVIFERVEANSPADGHEYLENFLREIQAFITALWLRADNSANCELAFAICLDKTHVHSNSLALYNTLSDGSRKNTVLVIDDLKEVAKYCQDYFAGARKDGMLPTTQFQPKNRRMNIASIHLQMARSASDLGTKISFYCSMFESMLMGSTGELNHKVAERIAFLLRDSPQERIETYRAIKDAYSIRSRIVHGDVLGKRQITNLREHALYCDSVARELYRRPLQDSALREVLERGDGADIEAYMLNVVFEAMES